jgi:ABC-2 type transport system ATP-binding protein
MDPIICAGLHYRYGTFAAVRGVDLTVRSGELFALLGTNGAGKTSTLEMLRGHRRPAAGHVRVLGADPGRQRRRLARRVGVVPQDSGFAPGLTVAETARLWTRLAGHRDAAARAARAVDDTGLGHRAGVRVRQLSGGERRRLDLAVALAGDPALLMLDEPTAGLDPESREQTWGLLRERLAGGTTVLLTTHYLEEAETLADRLAVLHRGQVAVTGTVAEVTAPHPATIRCRLPARLRAGPGPDLSGELSWTDRRDGTELTVRTHRPEGDRAAVVAWAAAHGATPAGLTCTPAGLADAFRALTLPTGEDR